MKRISLLSLTVCAACAASAFELTLGLNGDVSLGTRGPAMGIRIHAENWTDTLYALASYDTGKVPTAENSFLDSHSHRLEFMNRGKTFAKGCVTLATVDANTAFLSAGITSFADQKPETICLSFELPCAAFAGQAWTLGKDRKGTFPLKLDKISLVSCAAESFSYVDPATRKPVTLSFAEPMNVMLQDSRRWIDTYTVRISRLDVRRTFPKGDQRAFFCSISHHDGISVTRNGPVVISRGKDWLPIDYRKDILSGSALDFSNMGLNDAPAGKHGWLKAVGDRFEFEKLPGREQRFYGVNFCFDANVPEPSLATQVVTRLSRMGYNTIRIHHYEEPLLKGAKDGLTFNARNLDRFDRLCALAIENGLYLTTDIYVSRRVAWRAIGIDRDGEVPMQLFKVLVAMHPGAFENWKAFARNLLLHVNPYTGRRYVDEPGMPLISFINENTMNWRWKETASLDCCRAAWKRWLSERRAKDPSFAPGATDEPPLVNSPGADARVQCFQSDMERESARLQREFLVSLGSRALFTGQNCDDSQAMAAARDTYDYVDTHFYVDHPSFLQSPWRLPSKCGNSNPVQATELPPVDIGYVRLAEKPFTITEWNFSGPGMFRGVGGILTGALAALQDWDGLWRFAYSHSDDGMRDGKGFPGYFDMAGDPLGQASDRACICLFLRRDLGALADKIALNVGSAACPADGKAAPNRPKWKDTAWRCQVARTVHPEAKGYRTFPLRDVRSKLPFEPKGGEAIRLDRQRGAMTIETPCTAGGFAPSGRLDAGVIAFDVGDVAATVWVSSVDGRPLETSRRILLTHLTDAQADGNVYADTAKTIILKWGGNGTVVRNGRAKVSLKLANPDASVVWGLETSGRRLARIPAHVEDGRLVFVADVNADGLARLAYEIVPSDEK